MLVRLYPADTMSPCSKAVQDRYEGEETKEVLTQHGHICPLACKCEPPLSRAHCSSHLYMYARLYEISIGHFIVIVTFIVTCNELFLVHLNTSTKPTSTRKGHALAWHYHSPIDPEARGC
jgi:hypothetical protein